MIDMRKALFIFLCSLATVAGFSQGTNGDVKGVDVELAYTRLGGYASNQYAVWVETDTGAYVKTIFVTKFTARTGWKTRPDSLPAWVRASGVASLGEKAVDAMTGATPRQGTVKHSWDFTDASGKKLPAGNYVLRIEATTRWKNKIDYFARIGANGEISVERKTIGDNAAENAMIKDVKVTLKNAR